MIRIAKTENGLVRGLPAADPRITSFKGIPFAAPPVGKNRWKAPQPCENWEGIRDCYKFGPIAMQGDITANPENLYDREWHVDPDIPMSEDCLYLNVWTPAKTTDEKLPVYVWIYGGGLQSGYTAEMEFDGERIARRGIVVVSIAYRVNIFGYMAHPEITAENPDAPTNFGALDQVAGIEWAKRNAAAFGGDPDNITIGGQSMGGYSVAALLASPKCKGLFQKAVIESGYWQFFYTPQHFSFNPLCDAEEKGKKFFEHIGVKNLEEARALDAFELRKRAEGYRMGVGGIVTDMKFLYDDVNAIIERGEALNIPILFGNTGPEFHDCPVGKPKPGMPPFLRPKASTMEEFEENIRSVLGDKADEFIAICKKGGESVEEMVNTADLQSTELVAYITSKLNAKLGNPYKLYYYKFDPFMPGFDNPGAFHSSDLWFFFETLAKCWRPFDGKYYDLARQMCNYLANFIKSGDPNGADADGSAMPTWTVLTPDTPYAMSFTEKGSVLENHGPSEVIDFISDYYIENLNK